MTEQDWLTATDPRGMGLFLRVNSTDSRKQRLFLCARARRIWKKLKSAAIRRSIEVGEGFADRSVSQRKLAETLRVAKAVGLQIKAESHKGSGVTYERSLIAAACSAKLPQNSFLSSILHSGQFPDARDDVSGLLRDLFGNPFRPVRLNPSWRTPIVISLAQAIYDDRCMPRGLFYNQRMGILADALEDAGCDNADILSHLRGGGDHVRGCWAVDLVLGKT